MDKIGACMRYLQELSVGCIVPAPSLSKRQACDGSTDQPFVTRHALATPITHVTLRDNPHAPLTSLSLRSVATQTARLHHRPRRAKSQENTFPANRANTASFRELIHQRLNLPMAPSNPNSTTSKTNTTSSHKTSTLTSPTPSQLYAAHFSTYPQPPHLQRLDERLRSQPTPNEVTSPEAGGLSGFARLSWREKVGDGGEGKGEMAKGGSKL